jgi:ABC-2 type transport system permease protein
MLKLDLLRADTLSFELKRLFHGGATKISLLVFIVSGLLAIYLGANSYKALKIDQIKSAIVFEKEREHIKKGDKIPAMGSLAYHAYGPTAWQLSPWAALFVGQSQNNLVAMKVNALALQGQIYNKELINPSKHRTGGFDLGFILAYLLPILIGVLSVNLLSDERESGRWRLLSAFANHSAKKLIWRALFQRFILVALIVLVLFITSALLLSLSFDKVFFTLLGLSLCYAAFWFFVAAFIMSFNKGSLYNSLAFIASWLVFAILIPGFIHLGLSSQFTNAEPLKASTVQRLILNDGWDQDKQAALTRFAKDYPQYSDKLAYEGSFHWKWYYAMQQLSDLSVTENGVKHIAEQQQKQTWLTRLSVFSPSLLFQTQLNKLAGTDTQAHSDYIKAVRDYHQQIREFIYPYLFNDTLLTKADVDKFPLFSDQAYLNSNSLSANDSPVTSALAKNTWLVLLLLTALLGLITQQRFHQLKAV